GLILGQLLDEDIRLGCIGAAEYRPGVLVDISDLIGLLPTHSEVGAVAIVHEGEDAPTHRYPGLASVAGLLPGVPEGLDLLALLNVERLATLVELQGRGLHVHPHLCSPDRGVVRA